MAGGFVDAVLTSSRGFFGDDSSDNGTMSPSASLLERFLVPAADCGVGCDTESTSMESSAVGLTSGGSEGLSDLRDAGGVGISISSAVEDAMSRGSKDWQSGLGWMSSGCGEGWATLDAEALAGGEGGALWFDENEACGGLEGSAICCEDSETDVG